LCKIIPEKHPKFDKKLALSKHFFKISNAQYCIVNIEKSTVRQGLVIREKEIGEIRERENHILAQKSVF